MSKIRLGGKAPLKVRPQDSVVHIAQAMNARGVGAAAVIEHDKVVGVVSERDVLTKVVAFQRDPATMLARDIMSSPVLSISLNTDVAKAAAMMRENHVRHLVVLDEEQNLVGMLALRFLLYELIDEMEGKVGDLLEYIMTDGPGGD